MVILCRSEKKLGNSAIEINSLNSVGRIGVLEVHLEVNGNNGDLMAIMGQGSDGGQMVRRDNVSWLL